MTEMKRLRSVVVAAAVAMTLPFAAAPLTAPLMAQRSAPAGTARRSRHVDAEASGGGEDRDLRAVGHGVSGVRARVPHRSCRAEHYNIPLMLHDFPLQYHMWSLDAMIWARYLQDKVSPKTADEYRGAVFAAQISIENKDDLQTLTRRFFLSHKLQMPFVPDPTGQFKKEVEADRALARGWDFSSRR